MLHSCWRLWRRASLPHTIFALQLDATVRVTVLKEWGFRYTVRHSERTGATEQTIWEQRGLTLFEAGLLLGTAMAEHAAVYGVQHHKEPPYLGKLKRSLLKPQKEGEQS